MGTLRGLRPLRAGQAIQAPCASEGIEASDSSARAHHTARLTKNGSLEVRPPARRGRKVAGGMDAPATVKLDGPLAVQSVYEAAELFAAGRGLKLADSLGFDLTDSLAGHLEDVAHFFEGVAIAVAEPVAELDDLPLAI